MNRAEIVSAKVAKIKPWKLEERRYDLKLPSVEHKYLKSVEVLKLERQTLELEELQFLYFQKGEDGTSLQQTEQRWMHLEERNI